jgi:eukaryotic-like serine/threonine-protein kinase
MRIPNIVILALTIQLSVMVAMAVLSLGSSAPASFFEQLFQRADAQTDSALTASNNTALKTYENPGFGMTIQYPSAWSVTQVRDNPTAPSNGSLVAIFRAPIESPTDVYQENVLVNVQGPLPSGMTLQQYTDSSVNAFRNMSDTIKVFDSSPTTMGGLPAHKLVYTSSGIPGLNLKKMQAFTVVNGNMAYVVTFSAEDSQFNRYLPDVEKMVSSMRISEQATT